ncbi:MAG: ATP-binding protein [Acidobacteriota bacterium]|nr:ATP-binding protein [Acidobacteriota bacterium]
MTRCDCASERRSGQLEAQARIPRRYEHCSFENFDILRDRLTGQPNAYLGTAKLHAQKFAEEYPLEVGLLFSGPTGVGKTHLAVATIRELMQRKNVWCLFYNFQDLLKAIQDSYNPVSQSSELRVLQPVLDSEVLLLDDLAALNPSDWVKDTLGHIINSRYNEKKVTLITTTLPFDAPSAGREVRQPSGAPVPHTEKSLDIYGVTFHSRLYEMCKVITIRSDDYRKAIKQAAWRFHTE